MRWIDDLFGPQNADIIIWCKIQVALHTAQHEYFFYFIVPKVGGFESQTVNYLQLIRIVSRVINVAIPIDT